MEAKVLGTYGEVSARPWREYWEQGFEFQPVEVEQSDDARAALVLAEVAMPAYRSYVRSIRSSEVVIHVAHGLADIYLGHVSPGPPARPAPAAWEWEWREAQQRLCLLPTDVAEGTSDFEATQGCCASYMDPAQVRGWLSGKPSTMTALR